MPNILYSHSSLLGQTWLITLSGCKQLVGLRNLGIEVGLVREQLLEVDCIFIEQHSCEAGGQFVAVDLDDKAKDVVAYKGCSLFGSI